MDLNTANDIPNDIEALKAALLAARNHSANVESKLATTAVELAVERANRSADQTLIGHMKLMIAKLRHEKYGQHSERTARLLDQMEFQLEELEANVTEDDLAAEDATAKTASGTSTIKAYERRKPVKKPFPEHLPRERVVIPGPTSCSCCSGTRLVKLGEDVTETLEV